MTDTTSAGETFTAIHRHLNEGCFQVTMERYGHGPYFHIRARAGTFIVYDWTGTVLSAGLSALSVELGNLAYACALAEAPDETLC